MAEARVDAPSVTAAQSDDSQLRPKRPRRTSRWTMGSICSGLGTCHRAAGQIQKANKWLEIEFVFSCEIGHAARKVLARDFPGVPMFADAVADHSLLPICDILTAGFPCQPYSAANRRRKGSADPKAEVVDHILEYIRRARPRIVIMENVMGILAWGRDVLTKVVEGLRGAGYQVALEKLSARVHGGLPQKRRRLYVVGTLKPQHAMQWPSAIPMKTLPSILSDDLGEPLATPRAPAAARKLRRVRRQLQDEGVTATELPYLVANCHAQSGELFAGCTPCLTAARGAQGGFWLLGRHRMMSVEELLRLQGFDPLETELAQTVSARQAGSLLGNAFTLTVVGRVLVNALCSHGLAVEDPFV